MAADTFSSTYLTVTNKDPGTHEEVDTKTLEQGKSDCSSSTKIELVSTCVSKEDEEDPSLLFELEPKNISNDFSLSLSENSPDKDKTDSTPSYSVKIPPIKISSSSPLVNVSAAIATPKLHSAKTIKSRKLLYRSPLQASSGHLNKTVISTSTPRLTPLLSNTCRPVKTKCSTELGDTIVCYHCGNTINILQGRLANYRAQVGADRPAEVAGKTLQETGRTVFDLEKLAETGKVKESIFSIEHDDRDKSQILVDLKCFESFLSKRDAVTSGEKTAHDSLVKGIDSTRTNDPTPISNKQTPISTTLLNSSGVSASDNLPNLFRPCVCGEPEGSRHLWTALDTLDMQEMLQLLETSTDEDRKRSSADEDHRETDVVHHVIDDDKNQESTGSEVKPPPLILPLPSRRILRPRKYETDSKNISKNTAPSRKVNKKRSKRDPVCVLSDQK